MKLRYVKGHLEVFLKLITEHRVHCLVTLRISKLSKIDRAENQLITSYHWDSLIWLIDWFIYLLCLMPLSAIFQLYHGNQFWRWKKPKYPVRTTNHGQAVVSFITCGCESSAPFFVIYKAGCEPTPYWW
jgi:hypothetical protein